MTKINIYFQDLNKEVQNKMREEVRRELKEAGDFSPEVYVDDEVVDDYINRHNFANEFEI